jgi:hypothetical protein
MDTVFCCNKKNLRRQFKFDAKKQRDKLKNCIQGVFEISTLILTSNRTHQKEQLFSLPFWRKTLRSGLKK